MHRLFSIPAVCALFAAALGGCAADNGDEGILIVSNTAAPDMDCMFNGTATQPFNPHGSFSVFSTEPYTLFPLMKSKITATPALTDARTILVEGARVTLAFPDESVLSAAQQEDLRNRGIMRFTTLFSAPLEPQGTANGFADIITPALLDELIAAKGAGILAQGAPSFRAELVATVVVFGDLAGDETTSQEFKFPVTICNDCIANVVGTCPLPMGTVVSLGNVCNPYQDGAVTCCRQGADVVCPAIVSTTP